MEHLSDSLDTTTAVEQTVITSATGDTADTPVGPAFQNRVIQETENLHTLATYFAEAFGADEGKLDNRTHSEIAEMSRMALNVHGDAHVHVETERHAVKHIMEMLLKEIPAKNSATPVLVA